VVAARLPTLCPLPRCPPAGWLKGPEDYWAGAANIGILPSLYYANGAVQLTLDTVVDVLASNPDFKCDSVCVGCVGAPMGWCS
jgi:hypothetical protein